MDELKKARFASIVIVFVFLLSITQTQAPSVDAVPASEVIGWRYHAILIESPQNRTIYKNTLRLAFTVDFNYSEYPIAWQYLNGIKYSIDGEANITLAPIRAGSALFDDVSNRIDTVIDISDLKDGTHRITITAGFTANVDDKFVDTYYFSTSVDFVVYAAAPAISDLSLENRTFNVTKIPLNFTVNRDSDLLSWIGYSLDNQENVTLSGNTTLSEIFDGLHSLIIYANDTSGNMGKSGEAFFSVEIPPSPTPTPKPTPTPTQSLSPTPEATQSSQTLQSNETYSHPFAIDPFVVGLVTVAVVAIVIFLLLAKKRGKQRT